MRRVASTFACCWWVGVFAAAARAQTPPQHTVSIRADGRDELRIGRGELVVRHFSWGLPPSITINGVTHPLTFQNNLSQPIPLALPDRFEFVQTGGRTILYPVETPVGLMIGASDELLGPDVYTWTLVAVPEPTAIGLPAAGLAALLRRGRRCTTGGRRIRGPTALRGR
jgi:hypothetical protein